MAIKKSLLNFFKILKDEEGINFNVAKLAQASFLQSIILWLFRQHFILINKQNQNNGNHYN